MIGHWAKINEDKYLSPMRILEVATNISEREIVKALDLVPFLARVAALILLCLNFVGVAMTRLRVQAFVTTSASLTWRGGTCLVNLVISVCAPFDAFNLDTGGGQSVLWMLKVFERASAAQYRAKLC